MAGEKQFVYNHDVAALNRRINRFIVEVQKSQSNSASMMNEFDQARLETYTKALRTYIDFVVGQPHLDLPETSPRKYELDENPAWTTLENEAVTDVIRMLELGRDELVNSQSARMPSGIISFDQKRITSIIDKIDNFLKTYIKTITPLDLPESSPMRLAETEGKVGV